MNRKLNRREFMKVGTVGVLGSTIPILETQESEASEPRRALVDEIRQQVQSGELVPVTVTQVQSSQPTSIPVVTLQDAGGHPLHIYVGVSEGNAIRMALESQHTPRPMTHDTMRNLLEAGGMQVECAVITELVQTTFYALLLVRTQGEVKAIDCRPSDAIALCLRTGSPLYANRNLMDFSPIP